MVGGGMAADVLSRGQLKLLLVALKLVQGRLIEGVAVSQFTLWTICLLNWIEHIVPVSVRSLAWGGK